MHLNNVIFILVRLLVLRHHAATAAATIFGGSMQMCASGTISTVRTNIALYQIRAWFLDLKKHVQVCGSVVPREDHCLHEHEASALADRVGGSNIDVNGVQRHTER